LNYIASNIRFLRKLAGLSQEQFAKRVDMNRGNIASYEKGNAEPSIEKLQRIVDYFNVNLVSFIENDLSQQIGTEQLNQNQTTNQYAANAGRNVSAQTISPQNRQATGNHKNTPFNVLSNGNSMINNDLSKGILQNPELMQNLQRINEYQFTMTYNQSQDINNIAAQLKRLANTMENLLIVQKDILSQLKK